MFIPLSDDFLLGNKDLKLADIELIQMNIQASMQVVSQCTDKDQDVIAYHTAYLTKLVNRLEVSLLSMRRAKRILKPVN